MGGDTLSSRGSIRTAHAPFAHGVRITQGSWTITPAKGSTLEGPVEAGGCSLLTGYYFVNASYYFLDGSW